MDSKFKKIYIIITIISISILSLSVIGFINYNSANEKGVLSTITSKEYNELLQESEKKLVYIGRPTCPDCVEIQPILEELLKSEGLTAYYYNTDKAKKRSMDQFNEIKETVGVQYVPTIIYYDGQEEVSRVEYKDYIEDSSLLDNLIDEYKDGYKEITN